jgi:GT2 family glycosyltransferase
VEDDHGQYDDAREVFWATGACFACRADVFHALGGFDDSFFAHQEEIDLCWRMWSAGLRVMVEPRSVVYHLGAGTLPPSPQKLYYNYRNNLAMLYKNLPAGWMDVVVFVRLVLDGVSALVYLLRGQRDNFRAVRHAHRDFRAMRRDGGLRDSGNGPGNVQGVLSGFLQGGLREKRREIQAGRIASPQDVYRGSIVLRYLLGMRRFGKLL